MTVLEYDPHERYGAKMTALALSFPTLRDADGVNPWDAERLEAWLRSGAPGTERSARAASCSRCGTRITSGARGVSICTRRSAAGMHGTARRLSRG
jgi:hypothetical protein